MKQVYRMVLGFWSIKTVVGLLPMHMCLGEVQHCGSSFKDNDFQEAEIVYVDPERFSILTVKDIPDSALVAQLDCKTRRLNGLEVRDIRAPIR